MRLRPHQRQGPVHPAQANGVRLVKGVPRNFQPVGVQATIDFRLGKRTGQPEPAGIVVERREPDFSDAQVVFDNV